MARLVVAVCLLILIAIGLERSLPSGELRDFGSFVASGRAGAAGQNPYGIHPLTFHVVVPGFDVWNPNLNPPISVPLFQLFDLLPPPQGFRIWWGISLACYLLTIALLVHRYGTRRSRLLPLWAFALAGVWDTLVLGQIYLPLVLAAVASWLLLDRGRCVAAGAMMGIVVAFKPNFAVWPILLLLSGHTRAATAALSTAAVLSAVPLITHGTTIYGQWLELIVSDKHRGAFLTNASIPGLAQRMNAGSVGGALSFGVLGGLAVLAVRRRPTPLEASALGILGGIAASPIAWVHYTLFMLPIFFASRLSTPLIVAAALLTVPVWEVLRFLVAPAWQQATVGSVYNWAVLVCLGGVVVDVWRGRSHRPPHPNTPTPC
ncbi:MAG: DUF2029 domain-containing protein [Acidobacteria bacterium]|nr:DUF2029 domain-containing protein [Acidobacteriota bacterium]